MSIYVWPGGSILKLVWPMTEGGGGGGAGGGGAQMGLTYMYVLWCVMLACDIKIEASSSAPPQSQLQEVPWHFV